MQLLNKIDSPVDLKKLSDQQLELLCDEIRRFLVEHVSETGGHLASNLGVVELTVALHKVFAFNRDRLVFDVGHQSYVHKLLTGRREEFTRLRKLGGISGFPRPDESTADAFIAGHASNAISVSLGMARARTLTGGDYNVVSLIGDGAMTGGLAYEGLSNAGASCEPMIIILNDNGMSITENVGGFAKHLTRLRLRPGYNRLKLGYRRTVQKLPFGKGLYRVTHSAKNRVKNLLLRCSFFEDLGLHYMGPVDGHDIKKLTRALELAKSFDEPVLLHVTTTKGKGYAFSELDPDEYHGVSKFSPTIGIKQTVEKSFSDTFGETMLQLAQVEPGLCAVTAAMQSGTGLSKFATLHPDRFFDVGIAEGHAVSMAAGMAKQGLVPVFAVYSTFLQRSFDMVIHDMALQKLHVILAVDRCGLVGEDGETHQGVFDAGFLCQIPNLKVFCPASFQELEAMLRHAVLHETGSVAIRYPRGGEGPYTLNAGREPSVVMRRGEHVTLVSYGTMVNSVMQAAVGLKKLNIQAEVVKLNSIKPLDTEVIRQSTAKTGRLLVVEDQVAEGCVGQRVLGALAGKTGAPASAALMNLGDEFITHGSVQELKKLSGLDPESIARRAIDMM